MSPKRVGVKRDYVHPRDRPSRREPLKPVGQDTPYFQRLQQEVERRRREGTLLEQGELPEKEVQGE